MQTSDAGVAAIELEEGVVLKAYLCPAGHLTIGAGLTASSGVIVPKPGMTITRKEASRLLKQALSRNYEPAVAKVMPGARQHEFDGGTSFHFNTGAISRASWVQAWRARDWSAVADKIGLWVKGGGKVLPGLQRRRQRELAMIRDAVYPTAVPARSGPGVARFALKLDEAEIRKIRETFRALGYEPGPSPIGVAEIAVRNFQREHDLTVDGILGRATLSTLERRRAARAKTRAAGAAGVGGGAVTQADTIATPAADPQPALEPALSWAGWVALALVIIWLAVLAWRYRDVLAVKLQTPLPRVAAWLRSF
ncbi:glycoside hydrolase family protein [Pseudoruegeria sp. HB172150]|uniref:glycoside hydrolase family protein n=1 Tax=Pseudoruegeria sp. HB172150 TaxID=2721164 RepID=UPI0015553D58|nr:glycoside hydrolase family protein [Pseudoruegeria sp. HB172150]